MINDELLNVLVVNELNDDIIIYWNLSVSSVNQTETRGNGYKY